MFEEEAAALEAGAVGFDACADRVLEAVVVVGATFAARFLDLGLGCGLPLPLSLEALSTRCFDEATGTASPGTGLGDVSAVLLNGSSVFQRAPASAFFALAYGNADSMLVAFV